MRSPRSRPRSATRSARGRGAISYLIERDGFLFQSPIAWFAQQRRVGYLAGLRDGQPAAELRACHPARVPVLPHEPRPFRGRDVEPLRAARSSRATPSGASAATARATLHAERGGESAGPDLTIVNPARLAPALRESVCQQCHLQGWFRFPRAGHDFFDFRPGLPLHRFLACLRPERSQSGPDGADRASRSRWSRAAASAPAGESWAASRATTRTACRRPPPRPSTIAADAWSATSSGAVRCRRPSGGRGGRARTASPATCRARPSRTSPTRVTTDHRIPRVRRRTRPEARSPAGGARAARRVRPSGLSLGPDDRGGTAGGRARPGRGPGAGGARRCAPRRNWPASPRRRPSPCSRRRSATVPTTCLPANPSATPWGCWTDWRRRIAPTKRSSASNRAASRPSLTSLVRWPASDGPTWRPRALREAIAVNPWRSDYRLALARYLRPGGGLARGGRGLPRGDPAQPRAVRGPVAAGPVLSALRRACGRPTPSSAPCSASTPTGARTGSDGTSARSGRPARRRPPQRESHPA